MVVSVLCPHRFQIFTEQAIGLTYRYAILSYVYTYASDFSHNIVMSTLRSPVKFHSNCQSHPGIAQRILKEITPTRFA